MLSHYVILSKRIYQQSLQIRGKNDRARSYGFLHRILTTFTTQRLHS